MKNYDVHILFEFKKSPWGGGNQFLSAIRSQFKRMGVYSNSISNSNIILYNSHHFLKKVINTRLRYPEKTFVHRLDGPVALIRTGSIYSPLDKKIFRLNNLVADATIFQSNWSRKMNEEVGYTKGIPDTVIMNAADKKIFNKNGKCSFNPDKVKLIATSWSSNYHKGFKYYELLDKSLNFEKYEMTFVGNSLVEFENINHIPPKKSKDLANLLKKHDIFITASKNDPCSNSLIEAMHCDLPAVVLNSGGHPEIIGNAGETFNDEKELLKAIDTIVQGYELYQNSINLPSIQEVAQKYYDFMCNVYEMQVNGEQKTKSVNYLDYIRFMSSEVYDKIKSFVPFLNSRNFPFLS